MLLDTAEYDIEAIMADLELFRKANGFRESDLTAALDVAVEPDAIDTPLGCVAISTPPQEGKTTWIANYVAWQLVRNPKLKIVYATYSQARANAVSRQIRSLVKAWTPLKAGSSSVQMWETKEGGGLLAAGRGSAMTGFRSDMTIIDDPIKDMVEAMSDTVREQTVEWFSSVVMTRMANLSQIIVIATRWHKDDLIAHVQDALDAEYINIPAQAVYGPTEDADGNIDILLREIGEYLQSVQNRDPKSWATIKKAVGTYTWEALYQGDPKVTGGSYIKVDKIDVVPHEGIVWADSRGFMQTLERALVIQSWDLTFGSTKSVGGRKKDSSGDYVAGQVWACIGGTWFLVDRFHKRVGFTETVSAVLKMSAKWPQTARIYVENAANGAALINTLKKRAALIKPVTPQGSKEVRAMATQPMIENGLVKFVDAAIDPAFLEELSGFPFAKHDDQVDALTQALNNAKADYISMGQ